MGSRSQPRGQRSDKGRIKTMRRDVAAQMPVGEQGVMRLDHICRLLGEAPQRATHEPGKVSLTTARRVVARWERAGLARCKLLLSGEPPWVWLTTKGLRELALPYREVPPSIALINHHHWVNHVYFWCKQLYPNDQWISERRLRKEAEQARQRTTHIADAEIHRYDDSGELTTIAVEVELTVKESRRSLAIMQELARRYDGIWYFTNTVTDAAVKRTISQLDEEVSTHFRIRNLADLP